MLTVSMVIGAIIFAPIILACIFHAMLCVSLRQQELGK